SEARPYAVSVQYATQNGAPGVPGTATAPADYAAVLGTLTFSPGETTKSVPITVAGDALNELDEGFTLNLFNATNGTVGTALGVGRLVDNDPLPVLTGGDASG